MPLDVRRYYVIYQVKHTYVVTYIHAYIPGAVTAVVIIVSKVVSACQTRSSYHFYSVVCIVHPDMGICSDMHAYDYIPQPCCLCGLWLEL